MHLNLNAWCFQFTLAITLDNCNLNTDQNKCDYDSCCNWAALRGRSHWEASLKKASSAKPLFFSLLLPCGTFFQQFLGAHKSLNNFYFFQLKARSRTARQCHFRPRQPITLNRSWVLLLTTSFLFCCWGSSGKNKIMATLYEKLMLAAFFRCNSKVFLERPRLVQCFSVWSVLNSTHPLLQRRSGGDKQSSRGRNDANQSISMTYPPYKHI